MSAYRLLNDVSELLVRIHGESPEAEAQLWATALRICQDVFAEYEARPGDKYGLAAALHARRGSERSGVSVDLVRELLPEANRSARVAWLEELRMVTKAVQLDLVTVEDLR